MKCGSGNMSRSDLDTSPMGIIRRISRLERKIDPRLNATFRKFGQERGSFDVLAALRRLDRPYCSTPTELFKSLLLSSGAMTHRIDCLEELPHWLPLRNMPSLTCLRPQPKMSAKWRTPHHCSGRPFPTTGSWKSWEAAGWAWSTRPKILDSIGLSL